MLDTLLKQMLFITLLFIISFEITAASATATVSANIVPNTSLLMSGNIIMSKSSIPYSAKKLNKINGINIETISFNSKGAAKIKINASHNANYDISVSPSSTLSYGLLGKVKITQIQSHNNFSSSNNNQEQELIIEAVIEDPDFLDNGTYIGTVEINVNYN